MTEQEIRQAVLENIATRRSVRKFKPDAVPKAAIETICEAGLQAASGMNTQSAIIVAITDKTMRDKIAAANAEIWGKNSDPFYGAPVILAVLADASWRNRVYDGSLALGNMMLAAHALGLGTCWIHRAKQEFEQEEWKAWLRSLGVEREYEGIGHLALGYPDVNELRAPARKPNRLFWC